MKQEPSTENVGKPSERDQKDGVHHHVGRDDILELGMVHPEFPTDNRQGHIDGRSRIGRQEGGAGYGHENQRFVSSGHPEFR